MTNDLVERLRAGEDGLELAAADEIESLEKDLEMWRGAAIRLSKYIAEGIQDVFFTDKASQETSDS